MISPSQARKLLIASALLTGVGVAEDVPATDQTQIVGPVADGTPVPSAPSPIPDLVPVDSQTRRVEVVEAPPMPGLPPVAGTASYTVRKVADPQITVSLPPVTSAPEGQTPPAGPAEATSGTEPMFINVTVYDHRRSYVQIYSSGKAEGRISGWSNIDFNHFNGISSYRVTHQDGSSKDVGLMIAAGNTAASASDAPQIPTLPDLATGGPSYVVTEGEDSVALTTFRQLHQLYQTEGTRLKDAYLGRVAAEEERRAELLAHPPKPKDVVIHYWRGKRPETNTNEGGDK